MPNPTVRNVALDYLRAFTVLLVVAHHTALAYTTFFPAAAAAFSTHSTLWEAFPILDRARSPLCDLLVAWNDTFFMSLLFLLSGLFVRQGIEKRGAAAYLKRRFLRLGIPFLACAAVLAPLAYYPSYRLSASDPGPVAYAKAWISLPNWPSGPAWFLWVLLAFDCLAVSCVVLAPNVLETIGRSWTKLSERSWILYLVLVAISAAVYLPPAMRFTPIYWSTFGPFAIQTSRILHYCLYFFVGLWIGESGILAVSAALARRWWLWALASLVTFAASSAFALSGKAIPAALGFAATCAASCFFLLAVFTRFAKPWPFASSLGANSFGIYLAHYAAVIWLQFALLNAPFPALVKAALVFIAAVALSWAASATFRSIGKSRRRARANNPSPAVSTA